MAVDHVKGVATNPQSMNLYVYVLNNPLKFIDLLGMFYSDTEFYGAVITTNSSGNMEFHLEKAPTRDDIIALQIRLQTLGYLSRDFDDYGDYLFSQETKTAIIDFKNTEMKHLGKSKKNSLGNPLVDSQVWKALGLVVSPKGTIIGPSPTQAELNETNYANAIARGLLDVLYKQIKNVPFPYYGDMLDNYSMSADYYKKLQCAIDDAKLSKFLFEDLLKVAQIGYSSFKEALQYSGGEPITTVGGTAIIFLGNYLYGTGPMFSDIYAPSLGKLQNAKITKAAEQYDYIYESPLRFVITPDKPRYAYEYSKSFVFTAIDKVYMLENVGDITKETRQIAVNYLESIVRLNFDADQRNNTLYNLPN